MARVEHGCFGDHVRGKTHKVRKSTICSKTGGGPYPRDVLVLVLPVEPRCTTLLTPTLSNDARWLRVQDTQFCKVAVSNLAFGVLTVRCAVYVSLARLPLNVVASSRQRQF